MLGYEEIEEIIDKITEKITFANREGTLDNLLISWGLNDLVQEEPAYDTDKNGKIVVVGASEVKEEVFKGVVKSLGLDKSRFEFDLDYNDLQTYPYRKLRYATQYRLVMFGPVPHSTSGKLNSGSVIAEMQNHEGYPRVEVLSGNNAVKITKTNFRNTLNKLISEKYI